MLHKKIYHFHFIAVITVLGLFSSMVHYHSEGLECLDHVEDTHIAQTEDYCPITTLVSDCTFENPLSFDGFIEPQDLVIETNLIVQAPSFSSSKFGRAPPSLA